MKNSLVAVAIGIQYRERSEKMIASFLEHNPDWNVERFYDDRLNSVLPEFAKNWSAFDRCEIGRWCAIKSALETSDTAFYCDNDVLWYGKTTSEDMSNDVVLYHHYVTDKVRKERRSIECRTGFVNLGMFQIRKNAASLCDSVVSEVLDHKFKYMHNNCLWLQNLASLIPCFGYDMAFDNNPGMNVAYWGLQSNDRSINENDGVVYVTADNTVQNLRSLHFSCIDHFESLGDLPKKIARDYRK